MNCDLCCRMATLFIVGHSYVRRVAKNIEMLILKLHN